MIKLFPFPKIFFCISLINNSSAMKTCCPFPLSLLLLSDYSFNLFFPLLVLPSLTGAYTKSLPLLSLNPFLPEPCSPLSTLADIFAKSKILILFPCLMIRFVLIATRTDSWEWHSNFLVVFSTLLSIPSDHGKLFIPHLYFLIDHLHTFAHSISSFWYNLHSSSLHVKALPHFTGFFINSYILQEFFLVLKIEFRWHIVHHLLLCSVLHLPI